MYHRVQRVRDYHQVNGSGRLDDTQASEALGLFQIDQYGLDDMDRRFLALIHNQFDGGPVGLDSMAASLGEERGTLEEVIEPFLIMTATKSGSITLTRVGFIKTTRVNST